MNSTKRSNSDKNVFSAVDARPSFLVEFQVEDGIGWKSHMLPHTVFASSVQITARGIPDGGFEGFKVRVHICKTDMGPVLGLGHVPDSGLRISNMTFENVIDVHSRPTNIRWKTFYNQKMFSLDFARGITYLELMLYPTSDIGAILLAGGAANQFISQFRVECKKYDMLDRWEFVTLAGEVKHFTGNTDSDYEYYVYHPIFPPARCTSIRIYGAEDKQAFQLEVYHRRNNLVFVSPLSNAYSKDYKDTGDVWITLEGKSIHVVTIPDSEQVAFRGFNTISHSSFDCRFEVELFDVWNNPTLLHDAAHNVKVFNCGDTYSAPISQTIHVTQIVIKSKVPVDHFNISIALRGSRRPWYYFARGESLISRWKRKQCNQRLSPRFSDSNGVVQGTTGYLPFRFAGTAFCRTFQTATWILMVLPKFSRIHSVSTRSPMSSYDFRLGLNDGYNIRADQFGWYHENGVMKDFIVNTLPFNTYRFWLQGHVFGRFVKLLFKKLIHIQVEFSGCPMGLVTALGMQPPPLSHTWWVYGSQISVTNYYPDQSPPPYYYHYAADKGRLFYAARCWAPNPVTRQGSWFEINFKNSIRISAIAWERGDGTAAYVESFYLAYSQFSVFLVYSLDGRQRVFSTSKLVTGTITQAILYPSIVARKIRIYPLTWAYHVCLRFEVYGHTTGFTSQFVRTELLASSRPFYTTPILLPDGDDSLQKVLPIDFSKCLTFPMNEKSFFQVQLRRVVLLKKFSIACLCESDAVLHTDRVTSFLLKYSAGQMVFSVYRTSADGVTVIDGVLLANSRNAPQRELPIAVVGSVFRFYPYGGMGQQIFKATLFGSLAGLGIRDLSIPHLVDPTSSDHWVVTLNLCSYDRVLERLIFFEAADGDNRCPLVGLSHHDVSCEQIMSSNVFEKKYMPGYWPTCYKYRSGRSLDFDGFAVDIRGFYLKTFGYTYTDRTCHAMTVKFLATEISRDNFTFYITSVTPRAGIKWLLQKKIMMNSSGFLQPTHVNLNAYTQSAFPYGTPLGSNLLLVVNVQKPEVDVSAAHDVELHMNLPVHLRLMQIWKIDPLVAANVSDDGRKHLIQIGCLNRLRFNSEVQMVLTVEPVRYFVPVTKVALHVTYCTAKVENICGNFSETGPLYVDIRLRKAERHVLQLPLSQNRSFMFSDADGITTRSSGDASTQFYLHNYGGFYKWYFHVLRSGVFSLMANIIKTANNYLFDTLYHDVKSYQYYGHLVHFTTSPAASVGNMNNLFHLRASDHNNNDYACLIDNRIEMMLSANGDDCTWRLRHEPAVVLPPVNLCGELLNGYGVNASHADARISMGNVASLQMCQDWCFDLHIHHDRDINGFSMQFVDEVKPAGCFCLRSAVGVQEENSYKTCIFNHNKGDHRYRRVSYLTHGTKVFACVNSPVIKLRFGKSACYEWIKEFTWKGLPWYVGTILAYDADLHLIYGIHHDRKSFVKIGTSNGESRKIAFEELADVLSSGSDIGQFYMDGFLDGTGQLYDESGENVILEMMCCPW